MQRIATMAGLGRVLIYIEMFSTFDMYNVQRAEKHNIHWELNFCSPLESALLFYNPLSEWEGEGMG